MKTINGWVQLGNCFVKKIDEKLYDVVRLEDGEEHSYYEVYDGVNLNCVPENTFSVYGSYEDYLQEKTDEQKAIYLAFFGSNYTSSYTCDSDEEITNILIEDKVIPEGESFKFSL